jgi:MEMO1 family protein
MRKHGTWFLSALAVLCLIFLTGHGILVKGEKAQLGRLSNLTSSIPEQTVQQPSLDATDVYSLKQAPPLQSQSFLNCKYYNSKDFMGSVSAAGSVTAASAATGAEANTVVNTSVIVGGVVPHHLLAGKMIAVFFKTLSESNPDTLVILAPNHGRIGHNSINTSLLGWNTDLGTLENDSVLTNWIISKIGASQDNTLMEEEHSISSLIPYIKYYMPDVKIVPILLHGNYPANKSEELGKKLADELSGLSGKSNTYGTVIIASVDFSHYLDAAAADKMDEKTLSAIKAFDIRSIGMMGNDNLDSPPSIIALLSAMKELKAAGLEVTGHNNSSIIAGKGADYTTSYFTILFRHQLR